QSILHLSDSSNISHTRSSRGRRPRSRRPVPRHSARPMAAAPPISLEPASHDAAPTEFLSLGLDDRLKQAVVDRGFVTTTPIQSAVYPGVHGGVDASPQERGLRGAADIVVATPGRLLDHMGSNTANFEGLEVLVLDEADRMLDMGFWPSVRRIVSSLPVSRQTLLFSATMS